jgi:hypothetical protein
VFQVSSGAQESASFIMVAGFGARLIVSFLHYRKNPATVKLKELSDFPAGMSSPSFVVRRPASIDPTWRFGWLIPVTVIAVMGI